MLFELWNKTSPYRKALAALATFVAITAWPTIEVLVGDGEITGSDWRAIGIALCGAVLVYLSPNRPAPNTPTPAMLRTPPL